MKLRKTIINIILISAISGQTAEQIQQGIDYVKKTGMSESEVKRLAKSQGYSDDQINTAIQKAKNNKNQKLEDAQPTKALNYGKVDNSTVSHNQNNDIIKKKEDVEKNRVLKIQNENSFKKIEFVLKYFGYDIFKGDPALFQTASFGAVDPNYLIGPGDELIVIIWGETQLRQVFEVNKEGFIFVPEVGQIFVNGLNLKMLESKLFRVLSKAFASLNPIGGKATTFLDVSLGNLRPLRIQVLGEVAQPGAYTVGPSSTLFSSLYYFKGPTTLGSLRKIDLIRGDKIVSSIDFYDYLLTGKKPKDVKLQLDDIVFIPNRLKTIVIKGEVNRPGIYELLDDESLVDLVNIAGGLKASAYLERSQIDRVVPFELRDSLKMDRMFIDVNIGDLIQNNKKFQLFDDDNIEIFSVLESKVNYVSLYGAVARPGKYQIGDALRLSELIKKADNITGDAYLDRLDIIRLNPDNSEKIIKLNLARVLDNDPQNDILLSGRDEVIVYGINDMIEKSYAFIEGYVKRPGRYVLKDNLTIYDILFMAGGFIDEKFKNTAFLQRAELIRINEGGKKSITPFNLKMVLEKNDFSQTLLKPNDLIKVYSREEIEGTQNFVEIDGHVKKPGKYELYESNMTIYDLLFRSAGFEDPIHKNQTFLERGDLIRFEKNQINKKIHSFNIQKILGDKNDISNIPLMPGDKILIYSKKVFNDLKKVTIEGVVENPGDYNYKSEMKIKDLILEAGGVSKDVYRYRIELSRIDPNVLNKNIFSEIYTFDMNNDYSFVEEDTSESSSFKLKPYDFIIVRPDPYFEFQKKVTVRGAVYYPGEYVIRGPKEKISDIIDRAGGVKPEGYLFGSQFSRGEKSININLEKIMKKPKSRLNIFVNDGDLIDVKKKPFMIELIGEINSPGFYKFNSKSKVKDVINEAGGLTQDAEKKDIYITYPNGISIKLNFWNNPRVRDGSTISVGKKPPEEPFNRTEYLRDLTAIFASFAQALSIIIIAKN